MDPKSVSSDSPDADTDKAFSEETPTSEQNPTEELESEPTEEMLATDPTRERDDEEATDGM